MIDHIEKPKLAETVIVIDVGNSRTHIAQWRGETLVAPIAVPTGNRTEFHTSFAAQTAALPRRRASAVIVGSVAPAALAWIGDFVDQTTGMRPLIVGDDLPLPIEVGVRDSKVIGVDRVCAAAAAFDKLQTGCVVIDFGTAITVDLVSDDGVLVGGTIGPGLRMQLRALHEYTAVLPSLEPDVPELPWGRDTTEAMRSGVCRGAAGAVRGLVEAYATSLNRWPQVIATGGDLRLMAPLCDFIDTAVEHLVLRGLGVAYRNYMRAGGG